MSEIRGFFEEAEKDEDLKEHVRERIRRSPRGRLADREVRFGRRLAWYALVRALGPGLVVETGTDKGMGSCLLASALLRNGNGRLVTIDVNPGSGYVISGEYSTVTDRVVGDSIEWLKSTDMRVDLFVHDSLHTYEHEWAEYAAVEQKLSPGAVVLSDNAHATDALMEWANSVDRSFRFFAEKPKAHWYPGGGIGLAVGGEWVDGGRTTWVRA